MVSKGGNGKCVIRAEAGVPLRGTKGTSKGVEVVRVKSNHICTKMSQ